MVCSDQRGALAQWLASDSLRGEAESAPGTAVLHPSIGGEYSAFF